MNINGSQIFLSKRPLSFIVTGVYTGQILSIVDDEKEGRFLLVYNFFNKKLGTH